MCISYTFMWLSRHDGISGENVLDLVLKLANTRSYYQSKVLLDPVTFDRVGPLTFPSVWQVHQWPS